VTTLRSIAEALDNSLPPRLAEPGSQPRLFHEAADGLRQRRRIARRRHGRRLQEVLEPFDGVQAAQGRHQGRLQGQAQFAAQAGPAAVSLKPERGVLQINARTPSWQEFVSGAAQSVRARWQLSAAKRVRPKEAAGTGSLAHPLIFGGLLL